MNFTREPIIETVITPREGCRLLIRSSKTADREEYSVEAVEVISFGHSFFFRSLDRTKPFLVPMADYELLEEKEVRMALKNAAPDRSIKIGGGRPPAPREPEPEENEPSSQESAEQLPLGNRRRDKRRSRRRRSGPVSSESNRASSSPGGIYPNVHQEMIAQQEFFESAEDEESDSPMPAAPLPVPVMSKLLPPPTTLIKETLGRYKTSDEFSAPLPPPLYHHALPPASGHAVEDQEASLEDKDFDEPL